MSTTVTVLDSSGATQTVNTLPPLGSAVMAASLPVTLASDGPMVTVSGTVSDTAYTGSGNATNNALLKAIANNALSTAPSPVVGPGSHKEIAAATGPATCGTTGAVGDYLSHVTIIPATTSPGSVTIQDAGGSAITIFTGGASSVTNLVPFGVPLGLNAAAGPWKVTTGANVSAIAVGKFT